MTVRELIHEKQIKIHELKKKLAATDYIAIKYATGLITEEEYEPVALERAKWRVEINALESSINVLKGN